MSYLDFKEKELLRDFLSGLLAGVISVTVCNPLDTTRTRLNVLSSFDRIIKYNGFVNALNTIWRQQGLKGLFAGYKVNVKAVPIFHSIFFPVYEGMKQFCKSRNFSKWEEYLTSSIVAGSFCNIITNPIWVIRTRVMAQALHHESKHYKTQKITQIMAKMIKHEGFQSLFKGVSASILGVSNAVIYFFIYQNFREKLVEQNHKTFNTYYVLLASLISKTIASTMTYPFIVVRTIMQDHRGSTQEMSLRQAFSTIYQKQGLKGFYAGLKPDLLRLLPSNTIVFMVYQYMKRHIQIKMSN